MPEYVNPRLSSWESFYVIVGSSGAVLIGLQFVMVTLLADIRKHTTTDALSAFGTPTVVHFVDALLIAAIMSAPWLSLHAAAAALLVCSLAGLAYSVLVIYRARRQATYSPVWEDWLWYALLPCCLDAALLLAALFLPSATQQALFVIGAASLGLLLAGIHNAWDSVTHMIIHDDQTN